MSRRAGLAGALGVLAGVVVALVLVLGGGHSRSTGGSRRAPAPVPALAAQSPAPPTTPAPRPKRRVNHHAARRPGIRHASSTRSHSSATTSRSHTTPSATRSTTSSTTTAAATPPVVRLVLRGGANAPLTACGEAHHYRRYLAGTAIAYSGTVRPVPATRWKIKLRLKVCRGGSFSDFAKFDAQHRDSHAGTFSGSFSAPAPGDYTIRAILYLAAGARVESAKRHLSTR